MKIGKSAKKKIFVNTYRFKLTGKTNMYILSVDVRGVDIVYVYSESNFKVD